FFGRNRTLLLENFLQTFLTELDCLLQVAQSGGRRIQLCRKPPLERLQRFQTLPQLLGNRFAIGQRLALDRLVQIVLTDRETILRSRVEVKAAVGVQRSLEDRQQTHRDREARAAGRIIEDVLENLGAGTVLAGQRVRTVPALFDQLGQQGQSVAQTGKTEG